MGETWGPTRRGMWRGEASAWVGQHETGAEQVAGVGVHTWTRRAELAVGRSGGMEGGRSPDLCAQQSVPFSRQTSAEALACCPHWRGLHTLSSHDRGALGKDSAVDATFGKGS